MGAGRSGCHHHEPLPQGESDVARVRESVGVNSGQDNQSVPAEGRRRRLRRSVGAPCRKQTIHVGHQRNHKGPQNLEATITDTKFYGITFAGEPSTNLHGIVIVNSAQQPTNCNSVLFLCNAACYSMLVKVSNRCYIYHSMTLHF